MTCLLGKNNASYFKCYVVLSKIGGVGNQSLNNLVYEKFNYFIAQLEEKLFYTKIYLMEFFFN